LTAIQKDGTTFDIKLLDCRYVPELWVNLFSVGKALQKGFKIGNEGMILTLTKGNLILKFDRIFTTAKGFVVGVNLIPKPTQETVHVGLTHGRNIHISTLHGCMTHPGESTTRLTASHYGINVKGTMSPCQHCALAKAKQNCLVKLTNVKSKIKGERLCIDISYITTPSFGGS